MNAAAFGSTHARGAGRARRGWPSTRGRSVPLRRSRGAPPASGARPRRPPAPPGGSASSAARRDRTEPSRPATNKHKPNIKLIVVKSEQWNAAYWHHSRQWFFENDIMPNKNKSSRLAVLARGNECASLKPPLHCRARLQNIDTFKRWNEHTAWKSAPTSSGRKANRATSATRSGGRGRSARSRQPRYRSNAAATSNTPSSSSSAAAAVAPPAGCGGSRPTAALTRSNSATDVAERSSAVVAGRPPAGAPWRVLTSRSPSAMHSTSTAVRQVCAQGRVH